MIRRNGLGLMVQGFTERIGQLQFELTLAKERIRELEKKKCHAESLPPAVPENDSPQQASPFHG